MTIEKRKYKRFFFPKENKIIIHLSSPKLKSHFMKARLLDISEGGIGVVVKRNDTLYITKGTEFIIENLKGMNCLFPF